MLPPSIHLGMHAPLSPMSFFACGAHIAASESANTCRCLSLRCVYAYIDIYIYVCIYIYTTHVYKCSIYAEIPLSGTPIPTTHTILAYELPKIQQLVSTGAKGRERGGSGGVRRTQVEWFFAGNAWLLPSLNSILVWLTRVCSIGVAPFLL